MEDEELKEPIPETQPEPEIPAEQPPAEPPAEPEQPKHPLYGRYADRGFQNDDEYLNAALDDLSKADEYRSGNEGANEALIAALEADPEMAATLMDSIKGYSFVQALARNISKEDLLAAYDSAVEMGDDDFKKSVEERRNKQAEMRAFLDEVNGNIEASKPVVDSFIQEKNISKEDGAKFLGLVNDALSEVYKGKITPEFLDKMYKAFNYAADVADAAETGEIRGRNANIEVEMDKQAKRGDGLPDIASAGTPPTPTKEVPKTGLEDVIEHAKRQSRF